jgi:hypothetical protein
MKKRPVLITISFALITVAMIYPVQLGSASTAKAARTQNGRISDHVLYSHLFRQIVAFKKKADNEASKHGKETHHHYVKQHFLLNDDEANNTEIIASQALEELAAHDQKAKKVIADYRAKYSNSSFKRGGVLDAPPVELKDLQRERDAIVTKHINHLRDTLGEDKFGIFDKLARDNIAPNIEPVSIDRRLPGRHNGTPIPSAPHKQGGLK